MNSQLIGNLITKTFTLMMGFILLIPSAYKVYTYCIFRSQSVAVNGIIEKPLCGGGLGGRPLIEYKDLQGKSHSFKSKAKTHLFYAPQKGEEIKVFYLQHDPEIVTVDRVLYHLFLPLFFVVIGTSVIVCVFRDGWAEFRDFCKH